MTFLRGGEGGLEVEYERTPGIIEGNGLGLLHPSLPCSLPRYVINLGGRSGVEWRNVSFYSSRELVFKLLVIRFVRP